MQLQYQASYAFRLTHFQRDLAPTDILLLGRISDVLSV